ncbi:hypothetical protein IC762_03350 [Bradyrhizobium genosp. L]|uniref:hypothetical protein n=1 Tax=Bradyrhizobium genosp. L TaxID=83637 RepID=UPI0018A311D9|nr:hypothetical protein [Bradyrhizobium genosp. L]QPF85385.1 hypothetical protein IC762_03350 [Bradyrhizobium genosp. L]
MLHITVHEQHSPTPGLTRGKFVLRLTMSRNDTAIIGGFYRPISANQRAFEAERGEGMLNDRDLLTTLRTHAAHAKRRDLFLRVVCERRRPPRLAIRRLALKRETVTRYSA